ncbi:MAG: GAF domain-containing protein [Proteobacteria bacterium]|nr:GAF domain-containing protein [Pseudomonadota bacterium]MBU4296015.1 GAF domain-containing protein [Pseudomonadota bacterium]MCG2747265.1 GAF domain-containing protein [Desulfobulbaceae bacterium]
MLTKGGPGPADNTQCMARNVSRSFPRWLLVMFVVGLVILLAGGVWFYRSQERHLRAGAEEDLAAVARLKVEQIAQWRSERLGDAALASESPFVADVLRQWLADPRPETNGSILVHFRSLQEHYHYRDVLLVGADGGVRLTLTGGTAQLHEDTLQCLTEAFSRRRPVLSDLHSGPGDLAAHLDAIAPLFVDAAGAGAPVGAVILQSEARQFLYPMIESWPGRSPSAETLLVRREADSVLFLNELRHRRDTAFKLRIPLSRTDVPAVMGVLSGEEVLRGVDYRGVEVLSSVRAVPDSPWFIVAKIDAAEVFYTWRSISLLIMLLILAVLAALVAGVAMVWQRRAKVHYSELFQAKARQLENQEKLQAAMREVAARNDIAQVFLTVVDDGMYHRVLAIIMEAMQSRLGVFGYLDAEGNFVAPTMTEVVRDKCLMPDNTCFFHRETWLGSDGSWPRAMREKQTIWSNEPATRIPAGHLPITRYISMPLIHQDRVVGLIQLANKETDYTAGDVALLETLGRAIAPVLDARLRVEWTEASRRFAEDLLRLRVRILEFAAAHRLEELLRKILDEVEDLTGSSISFYHFVESDQKTLTLQAWSTRTSREFCKAEGKGLHYSIDQAGVWVDCVQQRQPVIHNDYASLPHRRGMPPGHAEVVRELVVPILRVGRVVAILGIGNKSVDYTPKDVEIASYLADVAWEITERKMAEEEVRRLNAELEQRVTERTRELREAQEKLLRQERLAAVGQLAGGIGHELRKPLTVMANAVYYLRLIQPEAEEKVKEYLGILQNEVFFAEKILSDLLDFSRVKSVERAAVSPVELVANTLERFPAPGNITVKLDISPDLPPVYVDRHQMIQVLGNLVVNGCQAMADGGALTVTACREEDMVVFSVTDTGKGIPAENMARIFEPLFTTKVRGIGLGLAVSRKLVETNEGLMGARNEAAGGATFTVHLPIYQERI